MESKNSETGPKLTEEEEEFLLSPAETGLSISVGDGVVRILGLDDVFLGELVDFDEVGAMTLNLQTEVTSTALLGSEDSVDQGDTAVRSERDVEVPVGLEIVGTVFDPLGNCLIARE
jgi:F-type H+/Na+-transporting ATPase subunit alpha